MMRVDAVPRAVAVTVFRFGFRLQVLRWEGFWLEVLRLQVLSSKKVEGAALALAGGHTAWLRRKPLWLLVYASMPLR